MGFEGCGWKNWANIIAYLANVVITYVSLTGVFGPTNSTLSAKYQTLVTPAGWAFSIWGVIFIWEAVFVIAQMSTGSLRCSVIVDAATPWWIATCVCQCVWTFLFAQEIIWAALLFMIGILLSLLGLMIFTDCHFMSLRDYWLLRAPFSVHAGWIIAASVVNANVFADYFKASSGVMVAVAVVSLVLILVLIGGYQFIAPRRDAIICLVAAWACTAIFAELGNPAALNNPHRYNPHMFTSSTLQGLRYAALAVALLSLVIAASAGYVRVAGKDRTRQFPVAEGVSLRA